jgi:hypothetical protein
MNDLTLLSSSTELRTKTKMSGFRFEPEELAFFKKHVWKVWTPAQQRIAEKLRTAFADLSMNHALSVTYEVDFSKHYVERLSISSGEDEDILT